MYSGLAPLSLHVLTLAVQTWFLKLSHPGYPLLDNEHTEVAVLGFRVRWLVFDLVPGRQPLLRLSGRLLVGFGDADHTRIYLQWSVQSGFPASTVCSAPQAFTRMLPFSVIGIDILWRCLYALHLNASVHFTCAPVGFYGLICCAALIKAKCQTTRSGVDKKRSQK